MTAVNLNRAIRGPVTAVPVVAGKGVRIVPDTVNNRFVAEADETVLFDGALPARTNTITLSEPFSNFEFVDVTYGGTNLGENPITFRYMTKYCGAQQVSFKVSWAYNYIHEAWIRFTPTADNKVWTYASNTVVEIKNSGTAAPSVVQNDSSYITSSRNLTIVGINRIASN